MKTLTDLALMPKPKPKLDLQLYTSIWAEPTESAISIRKNIDDHFVAAERRRKILRYAPLPKLALITIAASVPGTAAFALVTYSRVGKGSFEPKIDKESDKRTCLRWKEA